MTSFKLIGVIATYTLFLKAQLATAMREARPGIYELEPMVGMEN
ncbi:hypothetical protein EYZ11_006992 [Aspergillus tanneri]|uniref:Uncharacterized protein n=1 Tax=Aspergillus tanneri TaxID=1220188 RepID=A0A4S3JEF0_9EURO|nr:hypothetical protein EYZ11_006992 [Aspergillus tanneri]